MKLYRVLSTWSWTVVALLACDPAQQESPETQTESQSAAAWNPDFPIPRDPKTTNTPPGKPIVYVPADYDTVQSAIDAAPNGAVIDIAAGNYNECLTIAAKDISLLGAGRGLTRIACDPPEQATVQFKTGGQGSVAHMTLIGGTHGVGGGTTRPDKAGRVTIERTRILYSGSGICGTFEVVHGAIIDSRYTPIGTCIEGAELVKLWNANFQQW